MAVKAKSAAARAMVMVDSSAIYEPVIFERGNPSQPGKPVPRRFLTVLAGRSAEPFGSGSGRLDLAKAITAPGNPLTARVIANRIWMHHFGTPLVENPNDFGLRTPAPTHPDLLDYLASELIRNGWRLKPLHRLIMTSAAYQRASKLPGDGTFSGQFQRDPENQWLWRGNRRRLDLEAMRDTLLSVSGQLDLAMFGRPASIDDASNFRRTVYSLVERQSAPEVFRTFDFPSPDASVAKRNQTTVPQQALFGLNSDFVRQAAAELAKKLEREPKDDRIIQLYHKLFRRDPSDVELEFGLEYLEHSSWRKYTHVLLMTNEFMFVD